MVVVSVDFRVAVVSPIGETVVPLEVDPVVLVTTPLTLVVFSLLVSVETTGAGITGVVVDCVVVVLELEEEDCAKAPPVMSVTAIIATNADLIMSNSSGESGGSGIARLSRLRREDHGLPAGSETTQSFRRALSAPVVMVIPIRMEVAAFAAAVTASAARFEDTSGQRERSHQ